MTDGIITDDHIKGAAIVQAAVPDIILAAEMALLARGLSENGDTIEALLAAAWTRHKELAPDQPEAFARILRAMADTIEASARPN